MSRQIFRDIEEALAREVRRITFHNQRTQSRTVLEDTFDPFTGEIIATNIEPDFYDSSADTNFIQYPNVTIKLLKTLEDTFSDRVEPPYGKYVLTPVATAPRAYEVVIQGQDGSKPSAGNTINVGAFQIRKVQVGQYLRLLSGNNIGTYIVSAVTISSSGPHTITVSNILLQNLSTLLFLATPREVYFTSTVDLNTVKVGDTFVDSLSASFPITSIDLNKNMVVIGGVGSPSLAINAQVTRSGNVFQNTDSSAIAYKVLDPTKPITGNFAGCDQNTTTGTVGLSPQIPINAYYLIRIDSKERQTHIDVLNRVWEEFNPPRTGLPVVIRTSLSFEQPLTMDVTSGGSTTINVKDNSGYNINDPVIIINKFVPTKNDNHGFSGQFVSKIIGKVSNNQLVLSNTVPDTFTVENEARVVSHASVRILMFNFVDHNTKDIDSAQYWVHEFTFVIELWIDRLEGASDFDGIVQRIGTPIEDLQGNVIIDDDP